VAENSSVWRSFGAGLGHGGDVVEEAHVQHAVGFVQHQGVQRLQIEAAALQVVHDAARRAHHDVRAMLQAGQLRAHGGAAAQGQDLHVVLGRGQAAQFLRHLVGQFARGAQHQGLHGKTAQVQVGQQGQRKGGGLAAAGAAWAIRSLPARASGRLAAWIGVIAV
jgi:hypothetical protein